MFTRTITIAALVFLLAPATVVSTAIPTDVESAQLDGSRPTDGPTSTLPLYVLYKPEAGEHSCGFIREVGEGNRSTRECPPGDGVRYGPLPSNIRIVEDYESYALVALSDAELDVLKALGLRVELIRREGLRGALDVPPGAGLRKIEFVGPEKPEWLTALRRAGVVPVQFLPESSLLAFVPASAVPMLKRLDRIWRVTGYSGTENIGPLAADQSLSVCRLNLALAEEVWNTTGAPPSVGACDWGSLRAGAGELERLSRDDNVMWVVIDQQNTVGPGNDQATWALQSAVEGRRSIYQHGLTGAGQTVAVADSGIRASHEAFGATGKIVLQDNTWGDAFDAQGHGTHVAGTVAGDALPRDTYSGPPARDGHAISARLVIQDISVGTTWHGFQPGDYSSFFGRAYDAGARVHTNSWWEESANNVYNDQVASIDAYAWNHPDFLIIFIAGNAGSGPGTLASRANAKNVIAVGGTLNPPLPQVANWMYPSSSRGLAADGRLRPTLVAPANGVWSAWIGSDTDYQSDYGTSVAAPAIAGSAALARQYFVDGWYPSGRPFQQDGFSPSSALLRAVLINGANEITGQGAYQNGNLYPNGDQGWGRLNLDYSLFFEGDRRKLFVDDNTVGLTTGQAKTYQIYVKDRGEPLEITLVWTDQAGAPSCNPCRVQDLDLEVTDPYGNRYSGNQFVGFNPGQSQISTVADRINTEEGVLVLSPNVGLWTVTVRSFQSPTIQPYALVATGGFDSDVRFTRTQATLGGPAIAVDAQEISHVVWEDSQSGLASIYYSRYDADWNQLSAPVVISSGESHSPSIAVNPLNGELWVVWTLNTGVDELTVASKSTDGGASWHYMGMITHLGNTSERGPMIAIDPQGRKHVMSIGHREPDEFPNPVEQYILEHWTDLSEPGNYDWNVRVVFSHAINSPACPLNPVLSRPRLTLGRAGYLHAAFGFAPDPGCYPFSAPTPTQVRTARSIDGGNVWTAGFLANTRDYVREPAIAAKSSQRVYVVWDDWSQATQGFDLFMSSSVDDGASWGTPWSIYFPGGNQITPWIQVEPGERYLHLAWADSTPGNYEIYHMVSYSDGVSWHGSRRVTFASGTSYRMTGSFGQSLRLRLLWGDDRDLNWQVYGEALPADDRVSSSVPTQDLGNSEAINPSIAIHPGDNSARLAWQEKKPDGKYGLYFSEIGWTGEVFASRVPIYQSATEDVLSPSIAVDPTNGWMWVVWSRLDSTTQTASLRASISSTGAEGTWTTVEVPVFDTQFSQGNPAIVIDAAGRKHIVSRDYHVTPTLSLERVGYVSTTAAVPGTADWDRVTSLFDDYEANPGCTLNPLISAPRIALRGTQGVHVSIGHAPTPGCYPNLGGTSFIRHIRSSDGGAHWSAAQELASTQDFARPTSIAAYGNTVLVAWHDWSPGDFDIFVKRSDDGGMTWPYPTQAILAPPDNQGNQVYPALAWQPGGLAVNLFFSDFRPGNYEIYTVVSLDMGATWAAQRRLSFATGSSYPVSAAFDSTSRLRLVWHDDRTGNREVYYANWL